MSEGSATRSILKVPASIELPQSEIELKMRRLSVAELLEIFERTAMKLGDIFKDHPGLSRGRWQDMAPMLIASIGDPILQPIGAITCKVDENGQMGEPVGLDFVKKCDLLDFSEITKLFYQIHEEAFQNLGGLFEKMFPKDKGGRSPGPSKSGSTPSSGEGTDSPNSGTSPTTRSVPSLRPPPQGRPKSSLPSLKRSTPPSQEPNSESSEEKLNSSGERPRPEPVVPEEGSV